MRKSHAHLAYDAIGSDDRHIRVDAVLRTLVEIEHTRLVRPSGADHLSRDGAVDVLLLEREKSLEALTLTGVLGKSRLLQPKPRDLCQQVLILPPHTAKVHIARPAVSDAVARKQKSALKREGRSVGPVAQQDHFFALG